MTVKEQEMHVLLRALANMTTPVDRIMDAVANGDMSRDHAELECDEIMSELDDETLCSDASALYALIRKAREILA